MFSNERSSVIWLHPESTTHIEFARSFRNLSDRLNALGIDSIFPPSPRISVPSGIALPQECWYSYTNPARGLKDIVDLVETLMYVDKQISDAASNGASFGNIFLGGIGQGGFLALEAALCLNKPFAGIICLNGDFPLSFSTSMRENTPVPVLLAGMKSTDERRASLEALAADQLAGIGYRVERMIGERSGLGSCDEFADVCCSFIERHAPSHRLADQAIELCMIGNEAAR